MHSKYKLAFDTIRQDGGAAEATGIDVVRYKSIAGFVSTIIIGLAGPFYAQLQGLVFPGMFTLGAIDVLVLIVLVVGGIRTMYGPVVGAFLLAHLNQHLQQFQEFKTMIFGRLLVALFLFFQNGIVRYVDRLVRVDLDERLEGWGGGGWGVGGGVGGRIGSPARRLVP